MTVFCVSYDLNKPGKDYKDLYAELQKFNNWCHPLDSTWFVSTTLSAVQVHDQLKRVMDSSDGLIVVSAGTPAAWSGLDTKVSSWLNNTL